MVDGGNTAFQVFGRSQEFEGSHYVVNNVLFYLINNVRIRYY